MWSLSLTNINPTYLVTCHALQDATALSKTIQLTEPLEALQAVLNKNIDKPHCLRINHAVMAMKQLHTLAAQTGSQPSQKAAMLISMLRELNRFWNIVLPYAGAAEAADMLHLWWQMQQMPSFALWHDTVELFLQQADHGSGFVTPGVIAKVAKALPQAQMEYEVEQTSHAVSKQLVPTSEVASRLTSHSYRLVSQRGGW